MDDAIEVDAMKLMLTTHPASREMIEIQRILDERCPDCGSDIHHFGTRCGIYTPDEKENTDNEN